VLIRSLLTRATIIIALVAVSIPVNADHSWSIYSWARQANPFTLITTDSMTNEWQYAFDESVYQWGLSSVLNFDVVAGNLDEKFRSRCKPKAGQIILCNLAYGYNNWLGLAGINIDRSGHITKGYAKMNDSYSAYWDDNPLERNHVVCQEGGHLFGLGHTSEDGSSQGTCMDYSESINSQWPNQHDHDQLEAIYDHLDSYNSYDTGDDGGGGGGNNPCNAPPGKGCNKFGFDVDNGPPMGVPVAVGLHYEIWVVSDQRGGYWIHYIRTVPIEYRHNTKD